MKKKVLLLLVIAIIGMSGCSKNTERATVDKSSGVTPNVLVTSNVGNGDFFYLIDRNTGVVYLAYNSYYRWGVTVLLNRDGRPVTAEQLKIEY
jgi:hypothetical protein